MRQFYSQKLTGKKPPLVALNSVGLDLSDLRGSPLEELARYGARLILAAGLQEEVAEFLRAAPYQRTPERQGSRNGHRTRNSGDTIRNY